MSSAWDSRKLQIVALSFLFILVFYTAFSTPTGFAVLEGLGNLFTQFLRQVLGISETLTLEEGQTTSITLDGKLYDITLNAILNENLIILTVDIETQILNKDTTTNISGINIFVKDVVFISPGNAMNKATIEITNPITTSTSTSTTTTTTLPLPPFTISGVTQITKEIGIGTIQNTTRYDVCGTDLGTMFDWNGKVYMAFGDTFGCPLTATSQPNWRSNTLAYTTDTTPADGITFDDWITTGNKAKEIIPNDNGPAEETAIPTAGFSIGNTAYIFYFEGQITTQWTCKYSSVAKSTDGQSWTKLSNLKWSPGNFNQVAAYKKDNYVYIFGTPCARAGGVRLMRVRESSVENKFDYEYLTAVTNGNPTWTKNAETSAITIVPAPVGELSVRWNNYTGQYMMMYLHDDPPGQGHGIEMRAAPNLWGPWSRPLVVTTGATYPCLYAPFMREGYEENGGQTIYFRMSRLCPSFNPYSTYWMKMTLQKTSTTSTTTSTTSTTTSTIINGTTTTTMPTTTHVNVLVLKYFPLQQGTQNLNPSITGMSDSLASIRVKVDNLTSQGVGKLTDGTKYHGYKSQTEPSLVYSVLESKEFLSALPQGLLLDPGHYRPDYMQILSGINICNYVDNLSVRQVWLWGYHYGPIVPVESNMAMGTDSKAFWNFPNFGDVSNSERTNDIPTCKKTYTLYNYNYGRGLGELLEDHGHQIESVLSFINNTIWDKFVNPYGEAPPIVNSCGWTHSGPNSKQEYQLGWASEAIVKSNCEDWHPDGGGTVKDVSCHTWYGATCLDNGGVEFKVWWMQNIPGKNNNIDYQGMVMKDWWIFYGDFNVGLQTGKSLTMQKTATTTTTTTLATTTTTSTIINGTTTTTMPGTTTTTSTTSTTTSTTTTTIAVTEIIINITAKPLVINVASEIRARIADAHCRLNKENVSIRYTTFATVKIAPKKMSCDGDACVLDCRYNLTPKDTWIRPMDLSIIANLSNKIVITEKILNIYDTIPTTTSTTVTSTSSTSSTTSTTRTTTSTTTTTVRRLDLSETVSELMRLQDDLRLAKNNAKNVADTLREIQDVRYKKYEEVSGKIDEVIKKIDGVISFIRSNSDTATTRQRIINELMLIKNDLEDIVDSP